LLANRYNIPLISFEDCEYLDLAVDGADEIAPGLALIKGGGGKLLREKIVASAARRFIVIADHSKVVERLGRFPLPVEVIPFAMPLVEMSLREIGFCPTLRKNHDGSRYVTDEGNLLLDCSGMSIDDPPAMATKLDAIVGVVEHGLFLDMAELALIADSTHVYERRI
jgi:ribose 5-phosphate isomerase A